MDFSFELPRAVEQPGNRLPRRHRENAGKDHRREQSKTDEGCEPYPQSFRLLLPRRQQPLFLPVELLHLDGDLFHQVLAAAGGHERDGAIAIALPCQLDAAPDDIEPRSDERLDPVQPRLLRGIVGSLLAQALHEARHLGNGRVDRLQILLVLGEHIAALAVFRRPQLAEEVVSLLLHLESVRDKAIRLIAASDEDGHGDGGGKDEPQANRHDDPGIVDQPARL